jgi:hypothetical protein
MENKIYNDDVERVVNESERRLYIEEFHRNRKAKRQKKMIMDAISCAGVSLAFGVLGCIGWLALWIAMPTCSAVGLYSAFLFGRFFENGKICGWH